MTRAALLALLVVLGLPAGVAGLPADAGAIAGAAAAGPPVDGNQPAGVAPTADLGDVAILTLDGTARSGFATGSMDVGSALAVQHEVGAARMDRYALEERLRATPSTEARKTMLFEATTAVEIRIAALREDERRLRADYANRSIDTPTYVRGLARLDARAGQLRTTLDAIQARADSIPQFSLGAGRIQLLEAALFGLEGPVRKRSAAAMSGDVPPSRVYVAVGETGVVLSTIDDGRYVREIYRADHFDAETPGGTSFSDAVAITERLYAPYAYNQSLTSRNELVGPDGGIYLFTMGLRQGLVQAYLDGATARVFFEVQERRLVEIEAAAASTGADNGTRLVANRSYPGGPMRLTVTDNATGAPLSTTVLVAGHAVETGDDGVAWTLAPDEIVEVTAVGPRGNVTISVRPLPPNAIDDSKG